MSWEREEWESGPPEDKSEKLQGIRHLNEPMKIDDLELFDRFNTEMYREYMRHYPKNGDSWKTCIKPYLLHLLDASIKKHSTPELEANPSHFIDIANFALFCYYRFSPSSKES